MIIRVLAWAFFIVAAACAFVVICVDRRPRRCSACRRPFQKRDWKPVCGGPIDMWDERVDCPCGKTTWWPL